MKASSERKKKITVLIPCYNEAGGIGAVLKSFPTSRIKAHFDFEIIVIDNNSTDGTAKVAREHGATVLHEPKRGKGNAMRLGFRKVSKDTDFVVMLDGDTTYKPEEILRLVEPLDSGFCEVVIGSRLGGRILEGSMTTFNRFGNWVYSNLVRVFYKVNVTDVLTGYFAWSRKAIERLYPHLESEGFAIEMEMVTKMAKLGEEIYSVPISYDKRAGTTNLRPIYDGTRILWMFTKNLMWRPKNKVEIVQETDIKEVISKSISKRLSIVIPALNEEAGIHRTIKQIPVRIFEGMGYSVEIIVVDNGSTDNTAHVSRKAGAIVVHQPIRGYGNAYKKGFESATGDIIATGDADMTYPFDALPDILAKMHEEGFDFINTDRLSRLDPKAMTFSHIWGNWFLSLTTKILFGVPFRDSQSGMWIFKRSILQKIEVSSGGMPFSQELKIEAYAKGFKCAEVPIEYRIRVGKVKLNTLKDGWGNISHLFMKRLTYSREKAD